MRLCLSIHSCRTNTLPSSPPPPDPQSPRLRPRRSWPRRSHARRCSGHHSGPAPPRSGSPCAATSGLWWPPMPPEARAGPCSARARVARSSTTRRRTTPRRAATTRPTLEEKQRENLKASMLVEPWILRIQAKCSSTGTVVGRKIHSMPAVLPLHTVHTMIEYFLVCALCS